MQHKLFASLVVGGVFVLTQLSTTLFLPAMPSLTAAFATTSQAVMYILSSFFGGYAIGQLLWGTLSDHYGRRRVLLLSLGLYALTASLLLRSQTIVFFTLVYAGLGFMAAAYTSVGNAILKDIYGAKAGQAIALISVAMATGPSIGPFLGVYLLDWFAWQGIVICLGSIALILLVGIALFVSETHSIQAQKQTVKTSMAVKVSLINRCFLSYIITLGLIFGACYALLDAAPFIFTQYLHTSPQTFALIFSLAGVSYLIGAIIVCLGISWIKPNYFLILGMGISFVSALIWLLLAYQHTQGLFIMAAVTACILFGFGIVVPAAKAGAMLSVQAHFGTAASLMKFTQTIICVGLISLAAQLHQANSIDNMSDLLLIIVSVALLSFIFLQRSKV